MAYIPMPQLALNLSGFVAKNTSAFEQVDMPEPEEAVEHLDYTFEDMHKYSDLNYLNYQIGGGATYSFENGIKWTVDVTYYGLDDRLGYVYGDETGSLVVVRSGVQLDF
ncbi:MAG TPA: hypothetical protein ENO22_04390 [candidate division Zixibacteria bacterium]|nr:hypothetical protein [candidate division Zixibacteria bacterium]